MRSPAKGQALNWTLRLIVGGAFVFAGALKIADPAKFVLDIGNYRLVPHDLVNLVAVIIPWLEITAGLFVLAGIWLRAAALLISGLTVVFFALIVSALARGLNIECGCFGTIGGRHIGLVNLAIDVALFALAVLLVRRSQAAPAPLPPGRERPRVRHPRRDIESYFMNRTSPPRTAAKTPDPA